MAEHNKLEQFIKTLMGEENKELDPMLRAVKAVHSVVADHASTTPEDLERQRAGQERLSRLITPSIGIRTEGFTIAGSLPAEWVRPEHGVAGHTVILYCHGGGYTCGQLGYARILASKLALHTGFDVLSFEYRLAPEDPYPAALEDAVAAWDHLMYRGVGARQVIVAGDSAGGNLALELALTLKANGRLLPRGLILMSPWTDMTCSGASHTECLELDPMLTPEYLTALRQAYAGPDADWSLPCYSPLFADLRGLPPALIQVGSHELLRSDSEELHAAFQRQEVYSRLEVYDECWHVFQQVPVPQAARAMESISRFVQQII